jgi:hypothetical protein
MNKQNGLEQIMDIHPVMIHWVEDQQCTLKAVHLACAVARSDGTNVILVKMLSVPYVSWLGSGFGQRDFTVHEREFIKTYEAIAQDYGINAGVVSFEYVTLPEAIVQAADYVNAQAVFAGLPHHIFAPWRTFLKWRLKHQLADLACEFYDLDEVESTASILVSPARKAVPILHK